MRHLLWRESWSCRSVPGSCASDPLSMKSIQQQELKCTVEMVVGMPTCLIKSLVNKGELEV